MGEWKRNLIQLISTLAMNANARGFLEGSIYQGKLKAACVPGLNCYSCPGALGACPVGSLQAALGSAQRGFPHYVLGTMILFGALAGRLICGFLCPFGFLEDLLFKLRTKKLKPPRRADRLLRLLKYAVLLVMVVLLPLLTSQSLGGGTPYFCKYVCPAGTLEGGIPLILNNASLRDTVGPLFTWKLLVLAAILAGSVFISRPFCKYLCPLGAFYGLFNRVSLYRMEVESARCVQCGRCAQSCPMGVDVPRDINSAECIRCGRCKRACPHGAIASGIGPIRGYRKLKT